MLKVGCEVDCWLLYFKYINNHTEKENKAMKMIELNTLKNNLKRIFNFQEEESYLSKLIENFEELEKIGENIPFKIIEIKRKGFVIKAAGLFGFISFDHMPWKYENYNFWHAVYPSIKGKIFFGKTYLFRKNPLSLILNGDIAQFKKTELNEKDKYWGIIINKTRYGLFLDFGYHFHWDCGSIVGMVHKSNLAPTNTLDQFEIGEKMDAFFLGINNKGQFLFGEDNVSIEWLNGEVERLIGEIVPVRIIRINDEKTKYIVNEKYNASLPATSTIYPTNKKIIKSAIKNFKNGDLIHCEILKVNKLNKILQLKWDFDHEIDEMISRTHKEENEFRRGNNSIENITDEVIVKKLRNKTFSRKRS